jgi:1-acyl-sn-glycerol-3-phosphate acyltransferase
VIVTSITRLLIGMTGFVLASLYGIALALLRRERSRVPRDYARVMRRLVHPPLGLHVEIQGEHNILRSRPCVYVVNHQSAFDVPILAGLYPEDTVLIAKKELRSIPLFGWLYEATGNILIDRDHNRSAVQRLREAELAIRERGVSVWMFPEGTRGRVPGEILPFKKGAFYLAVAAEVPVVPIVVSPVLTLFDVKRRLIRAGRIQVRVLDPIPTDGLAEGDVPEILALAHSRMTRALNELKTIPASGARQLQAHPQRS